MSTLRLLEVVPDHPPIGGPPPIALTPEAVYECRRRAILYRLITDCYSQEELSARASSYWQEELAWLDLFDDLLWQHLPPLRQMGMRPAMLYGRWIKNAVDAVFIRGFELTALLEGEIGIDRLVLHRQAAPEPRIDAAGLPFSGPSVYSRMLPVLAGRRTLEYDEQVAGSPAGGGEGRIAPPDPMRRFARRVRSGARFLPSPRRGRGGLTFLILHEGYDSDLLIGAAISRGHRCLLCDGSAVLDLTGRLPRKVASLQPPPGDASAAAARAITTEGSELWRWPDGWFDFPVSGILRSRIAYFVERVVPQLIQGAGEFRRLYDRLGVDYVVTPFLGRPAYHFAAVDGARQSEHVQRVQIEHGDIASDAPALALFNLFQFDHYFAPSPEAADYFRACRERYSRPLAEVHVGSYRWQRNQRAARGGPWRRRSPARFPSVRPIAVYVVTAVARDDRYLNNDFYPDGWYYELQTRIVDVLAADGRFNVVLKLFPGPAHLSGPIERYATDKRLPHLRVSRHPFMRWLPSANRVIFDLPSTGLYESALAGVPFLSLLYDGFEFRPAAIEEIAPWTAWFHDPDDAADAVAKFLDVERPPRPDMQPQGQEILRTLEELASRRPASEPVVR